MSALTNRDIANIFDTVADMLLLKGEIIHRVMAYRNAALSIREAPRDLRAMAASGELGTLPNVGKIISEKITEMLETGKLEFYENLKAEIPVGVVEMLNINGVGPKKAVHFWKEMGITSVDALETAAKENKLKTQPGMGAKSEQKILEGIALYRKQVDNPRTPLGAALPIAESILARMLALPEALHGDIAGSIRRGRPTIGDVDLLIASHNAEPIMDAFVQLDEVSRVLGHGPTKSSVELHNGLQVDLRVLAPERYGTGLNYFTGSQMHNIAIRKLALERGLSLNEHAFTPVNGDPEILCDGEEAVYATVGLSYIPPEIRENLGEIELAQTNKIPHLLELSDIQADLHMHTVWSDGKNTVREMVEAALERGLKYIVITDHSYGATIANGLSVERLLAQQTEVRQVDAEMQGKIRVLHGTEMEIRADGSLDFPDEVLQQLDFVIASLHVSLRQPREQITQRLLNAVRNPHIDLIAHPRGQLIPDREGADLDFDVIFAAAKESGIALEINANPARLDLEAQYARRASEMGIPITIDTDAHSIVQMNNMRYGVITGRRGWLTAEAVINTWSFEKFEKWVTQRGK